jgi:predicted GNAT superfamily acetyltransferase
VLRRLEGHELPIRDVGSVNAPSVLRVEGAPERPEPGRVDTTRDDRRLTVEIPVGFSKMLVGDPDRALAWRSATREAFREYLSRGYRVVDFFLERERHRGRYLLTGR